jgi:hypothetical protein
MRKVKNMPARNYRESATDSKRIATELPAVAQSPSMQRFIAQPKRQRTIPDPRGIFC